MWRRALLGFATVLAAFSLHAQQPHDVVLSIEPEAPVANGRVALHIEEFTLAWAQRFLPPVVERGGNTIAIHQIEAINSIEVLEQAIPWCWSKRSIDLGRLPAGDYVIVLDQFVDDLGYSKRFFASLPLQVEPSTVRTPAAHTDR